MTKIILFVLALFSISLTMKPQDIASLKKEDIEGRWVETERIIYDSIHKINEFQDTYIFKDNMLFHKGEAKEGLILFNVVGRYTVGGDSVVIIYKDFAHPKANSQKFKKLTFKVLSFNKNEMLVSAKDYDFEYKMRLKK